MKTLRNILVVLAAALPAAAGCDFARFSPPPDLSVPVYPIVDEGPAVRDGGPDAPAGDQKPAGDGTAMDALATDGGVGDAAPDAPPVDQSQPPSDAPPG